MVVVARICSGIVQASLFASMDYDYAERIKFDSFVFEVASFSARSKSETRHTSVKMRASLRADPSRYPLMISPAFSRRGVYDRE